MIVVQETDLLKYKIKAKIKFLLLHYKIDNYFNKNILIDIFKQKVCFYIQIIMLVNSLPANYKYVPKVQLK